MVGMPAPDAEHDLSSEQDALIAHWALDPWNFLTGVDLDGVTPIYNTKDEKDQIVPVKPFPAHLDYIKVWIQILHDPTERFILADKCRQMFLTTATLAYMLWECLFIPGRRWLLSKSTEDEAKDLIRDKIRFPVSRMPRWVREYFDIQDRPELRVDVGRTGSYVLGVSQNVAVRDARGGTASGVLVDEAAFQDSLGDIIDATIPMAAKLVLITTPNLSGPGSKVFRSYRDDEVTADLFTGQENEGGELSNILDKLHGLTKAAKAKFKKLSRVRGMEVRKTRRGFIVASFDWYADPSRDQQWLDGMRAIATTEGKFQAEFMRNWDVSPGVAFYSEFQANPAFYVKHLPKLINAPVYRGWDFGGRNPATCWLQYSPKSGRVWVIREMLLFGIDIYSFRDLVLYLSGERERSFLDRRPAAVAWLEKLERDPNTPAELRVTPWFDSSPTSPLQFIDYAGHEAEQGIGREAGNIPVEYTRKQILAAEGIHLNAHYTTTKAKTDIIRRLLQPFPDGRPGIYFDPAVKILARGFSGGITFARPTPSDPDPMGPSKDDIYSHLHEALGYVLVNAVPLDALPRYREPELIGWDRREPVYADRGDTILEAEDTRLDFGGFEE
jgi:hypothetical protein